LIAVEDGEQQLGYQALPRGVPVVSSDGIEVGGPG
jgi:hypothetical protein